MTGVSRVVLACMSIAMWCSECAEIGYRRGESWKKATQDAIVVGKCLLHCVDEFLPSLQLELDQACKRHVECNFCWDACDRLQSDFQHWGQLCVPAHEIRSEGCLRACLFHLDQDVSEQYPPEPDANAQHLYPSNPRVSGRDVTWHAVESGIPAEGGEGSTGGSRKIYAVLVSQLRSASNWTCEGHTFTTRMTLSSGSPTEAGRVGIAVLAITTRGLASVANSEFDAFRGERRAFAGTESTSSLVLDVGDDVHQRRQQEPAAGAAGDSVPVVESGMRLRAATSSSPAELITRNASVFDDVDDDDDDRDVDVFDDEFLGRISLALDSAVYRGISPSVDEQQALLNSSVNRRFKRKRLLDDRARSQGSRTSHAEASRQRVEIESVLGESVRLSVGPSSSLKSCSVYGEPRNELLVCFNEYTFWVWKLSPSGTGTLIARRITKRKLVSKIITMAGFDAVGGSRQRFQFLVSVSDHKPENSLVTWYRFPVAGGLDSGRVAIIRKRRWPTSGLRHLEAVGTNDGAVFLLPTVVVSKKSRPLKHVCIWIADVGDHGELSVVRERSLALSNSASSFVKSYETKGVLWRGEVMLVLAEGVTERETGRRRSSVTTWRHAKAEDQFIKIQNVLISSEEAVEQVALAKTEFDLFLAMKTDDRLLVYKLTRDGVFALRQKIQVHGRQLLPLDLHTWKDGSAFFVPSHRGTRTPPSLYVYDSKDGLFRLADEFDCDSEFDAETRRQGIGFSCILDEGRTIVSAAAVGGSPYLLSMKKSPSQSLVFNRITARLVDVPNSFADDPEVLAERLDQQQVLVQEAQQVAQLISEVYGAGEELQDMLQCDHLKAYETFADVEVHGKMEIWTNISSELPLPEGVHPLRLPHVKTVLLELQLITMGKTLDFIEERLRTILRLLLKGDARVVRINESFFRSSGKLSAIRLVLKKKEATGRVSLFDMNDIVTTSEHRPLLTGSKVFTQPLVIENATGILINDHPIQQFASRSLEHLTFEAPVLFESAVAFGSHVFVGDGYKFGPYELSKVAVPLYKSILLNNKISGHWNFSKLHVKSLVGEHQLVDGVILDRFINAVIPRGNPTDNNTEIRAITKSVTFPSNSRLSIAPGGIFRISPQATINGINITRFLRRPFSLISAETRRVKSLEIHGDIEVPAMTFVTETFNGHRRHHPLRKLAKHGILNSIGGTVRVTDSAFVGSFRNCPRFPEDLIPLDDVDPVEIEGEVSLEEGLSIQGDTEVETVNGRPFASVVGSLELKSSEESKEVLEVGNLVVSAGLNLTVGTFLFNEFNGYSEDEWASLKKTMVPKEARKVVFSAPMIVKQIETQDMRVTEGGFPGNIVTKSTRQFISSETIFTSPLTLGEVDVVSISGFKMRDDRRIKLHGDHVFTKPVVLRGAELRTPSLTLYDDEYFKMRGIRKEGSRVVFDSRVKVDRLKMMHGNLDTENVEDAPGSFKRFMKRRVSLDGTGVQAISGPLHFAGGISADKLDFERLNGHTSAEIRSLASGHGEPTKLEIGKLIAKSVVTDKGIGGLKLSDFVEDLLFLNKDHVFESSVTFAQPVTFEELRAEEVSGVDLRQAFSDLVFLSDASVLVTGRKRFVGELRVESEVFGLGIEKSLNGHHPSALLTRETREFLAPFTTSGNLTILGDVNLTPAAFGLERWPEIVITEELDINAITCGYVDGKRLSDIMEGALTTNGSNYVPGTLHVPENSSVHVATKDGMSARILNGVAYDALAGRLSLMEQMDPRGDRDEITISTDVLLPKITVETLVVDGLQDAMNSNLCPSALRGDPVVSQRDVIFDAEVYAGSLNFETLHGDDGAPFSLANVCSGTKAPDSVKFESVSVSGDVVVGESLNGVRDLEDRMRNLVFGNEPSPQIITSAIVTKKLDVFSNVTVGELLPLHHEKCMNYLDLDVRDRILRSHEEEDRCPPGKSSYSDNCGEGISLLQAAHIPFDRIVAAADFVPLGDTVTMMICLRGANHSCYSIDIPMPAENERKLTPHVFDPAHFRKEYLGLRGDHVRDLVSFTTDDPPGAIFCIVSSSNSTVQIWRRRSKLAPWKLELVIAETAVRVKVAWKGDQGVGFPSVFIKTEDGRLVMCGLSRAASGELRCEIERQLRIDGDFDVLGITDPQIAYRDLAGSVRITSPSGGRPDSLLTCSSSQSSVIRFLKSGDLEMLSVLERNEEEIPSSDYVGKIKIFKLTGVEKPSAYQTLPSMSVVDAETFNLPSCSSLCLVTIEEFVGLRVLCRSAARGFQEATLHVSHGAVRILHKSDTSQRACVRSFSNGLLMVQELTLLGFYRVVSPEI